MPAPRKTEVKQRVLKIIIPPKVDVSLQELKAESGIIVAEHVRQAINLYLAFWQPGEGIDVAPIYALAQKLKEERKIKEAK